jgi:beta-ribofuranosylaminobenzene 5'-phosphate synthase
MIRVIAPSRLHFGLFRPPSELDDSSARHFGGVGLMIDKPGVQICLTPAKVWSATGPLSGRALAFAQEFYRNSSDLSQEAFHIAVESSAPEHAGLGTGTQLGLAVATALALTSGKPECDAATLARRIGRGQRSGIGIHGFRHGGFLVDGGKKAATCLAPLIVRHDFPAEWGILLILPGDIQGIHGPQEREAFAHLAQAKKSDKETAFLCRLVLLGMLPALLERDLPSFGEALFEFNCRAGEMFKQWQGGVYSSAKTAAIVNFIRKNGVAGVGQSSWGPTVFAIHEAERARELAKLVRKEFALASDEVLLCQATANGAMIT